MLGIVGGASIGGVASAAGNSSVVAYATAQVAKYSAIPTKIQETQKFKPKKGLLFYNISCNLAIVGCAEISNEIGQATVAMGERFKSCNAGTTASQAASCFVNAVNAHAAAIVVNDVPRVGSGNGYALAAKAKIPIIGAFTGNPLKTPGEPTQAAQNASYIEATLLADYIISASNGKAHVLYIGENQDQDGVQRGKGFSSEMAKCTSCKVTTIPVDFNTEATSGPPAISAALTADPSINWVVGNSDGSAAIAVSVIEQLGKAASISVAGMDANPQDIQYMKAGRVQKVDATVGQGEVAWAAVDAAGLFVTGHKLPLAWPVNIWLITPKNVKKIPSTGVFFGPNGYQAQFKALWKG